MLTRIASLLFWRALVVVCLVLGIAGAFLPVLPTTPFLLLAAWAAGKGWPEIEVWLLAHPRWGPPIARWRDHRAVPRGAKWAAAAAMAWSVTLLWLSGAPLAVRIGVTAFLVGVGTWLWCRPER